MLVVVDANIIVSLLISKGSKHKLFFSGKVELISPDFVLFEISKHWKELCGKSKMSESDIKSELFAVRIQTKTESLSEVKEFMNEALKISPDKDDAEYFALALKHKCPIWSEDKRLKKQSEVEVLNTRELLEKLGLSKEP